jgi:hypothetical protein
MVVVTAVTPQAYLVVQYPVTSMRSRPYLSGQVEVHFLQDSAN